MIHLKSHNILMKYYFFAIFFSFVEISDVLLFASVCKIQEIILLFYMRMEISYLSSLVILLAIYQHTATKTSTIHNIKLNNTEQWIINIPVATYFN